MAIKNLKKHFNDGLRQYYHSTGVYNSLIYREMSTNLSLSQDQKIATLIKKIEKNLSGKHAVIIGRSNLNGKPMAQLLLRENCTVTIVHSKTKDLKAECQKADILVAAVGKANLVKGDWVKKDSIIIDVGINKVEEKIVGDVDFESVKEKIKAITPVPGGVGPMTIACLLKNTLECFKAR